MDQVQRQPREHEIERIVGAERPHHAAPQRALPQDQCIGRIVFRTRRRRVLRGAAHPAPPRNEPEQRGEAHDDEHRPPSVANHDEPTEQRADGRPDDRAELHRRGRACALQRRHASRQQAERARVERRLANAHQQAQQDQHDETAGETVCRSRETPEQKSTAQHARRTVAIREPAHHGLHRRVRPVEGRQDPAHLARGRDPAPARATAPRSRCCRDRRS